MLRSCEHSHVYLASLKGRKFLTIWFSRQTLLESINIVPNIILTFYFPVQLPSCSDISSSEQYCLNALFLYIEPLIQLKLNFSSLWKCYIVKASFHRPKSWWIFSLCIDWQQYFYKRTSTLQFNHEKYRMNTNACQAGNDKILYSYLLLNGEIPESTVHMISPFLTK